MNLAMLFNFVYVVHALVAYVSVVAKPLLYAPDLFR